VVIRISIFVFLFLTACFQGMAEISVIPASLDAGPSNLATTVNIKTADDGVFAWYAQALFGSDPEWFTMTVTNGTVTRFSFSSIPVEIHREKLPEPGQYSGHIVVWQGSAAKTVTVSATLLQDNNGTFPVISSDSRAYAGIPYQLSARYSRGWAGSFYWVTNYTTNVSVEVQSILNGPSGEVIFNEPKAVPLSLISKDAHDRDSKDTRKDFLVWNSPPRVDAGGPYFAWPGATVTVAAVGYDPNPDEKLLYSWQFDPPYGAYTPLSPSPTAEFVYTKLHSSYIVCVVSDTWTGVTGTYNGPLGGRGIAQVIVTNDLSAAVIAYSTNGQWSAWSSSHTVSLSRLPASNVFLRARPAATNSGDIVTGVEWRESPNNPVRHLITPATMTNEYLLLPELTEPGIYHFSAIIHAGLYQSTPADITLVVPGVKCQVVARGFQSPVPVWGVYPTLNPGNTNAFGMMDDSIRVRSDIDGWLYLDRPWDSDCFVELQRTVNQQENELSNYTFHTGISTNSVPHPTFKFPVTLYPFAGQLVNNVDFDEGVSRADATLVIHTSRIIGQCNEAGGFSFGNLPKSWPIDDEEHGSYYLVFTKPGWSSLCIQLTPSLINFGMLNALYSLQRTNTVISLSGTVRSSESGLPVGGARVWFGTVSAVADQDGHFNFTNLPLPSTHMSQSPTHVLLAEADCYTATRNIYYDTAQGGEIDVYIDGGETYIYGRVMDMLSGLFLTNGTIEIPSGFSSAARIAKEHTEQISESGYFYIRVPGGCNHITLHAQNTSQEIPVTREMTGTQPVGNDILFVPEPVGLLNFLILINILFRHKLHNFGINIDT
jgi:hypothetical protein